MKPDTVLGSPIAYFAEAVTNILDSEDDLEEVRMEVGG